MTATAQLLHEGRARELEQALFYRVLAGDAEACGDLSAAERLNELLADEQHHVSRLTARILELGERPHDGRVPQPHVPPLARWEKEARSREEKEVAWYEGALRQVDDPPTVALLKEILSSERHHRAGLTGKWMPATAGESGDGS